MDMVAELGAKVVERKLVAFPINHHLALRDPVELEIRSVILFFEIRSGNTCLQSPVGHSARGSPEEGIVRAFVTRRLEIFHQVNLS